MEIFNVITEQGCYTYDLEEALEVARAALEEGNWVEIAPSEDDEEEE